MLYSEKLKPFLAAHPCRTLTVDSATYRCTVSGKTAGETLAFLNGGMNALEMWMDYVDALSADRRVLLFDYKCFFSSAPKEMLAAVPAKKERFRGAHTLGWLVEAAAAALFLGAAALAAVDGIQSGFGFWPFFARFLFMLYALEIFDISFFDRFLLCRSGFFPRFYPEVKGVLGPHLFGYNKKTHLLHFALYVPASTAAAWLCTLF